MFIVISMMFFCVYPGKTETTNVFIDIFIMTVLQATVLSPIQDQIFDIF